MFMLWSGQVSDLLRGNDAPPHESPNPMDQLGMVFIQHHKAKVFLEVDGRTEKNSLSQWPSVLTKASHIVIMEFGCGQHIQPGEDFCMCCFTSR